MNGEQEVAALPRRTAHALYALLVASSEHGMPPSAAEAMIFDPEAMSPQGTAMGLVAAARRGLCFCIDGYWWYTNAAKDIELALEDRFLRETGDGDES